MSKEEFNALYERSVSALQTGDITAATRDALLTLLKRIKGATDCGEMDTEFAMELIKKVVVAAFLTPEQKVPAG